MSIVQRLHPEPDAAMVLVRHCSDARFVWNLALEQANHYDRRRGPTPNAAARMRQLAEARQAFAWLGEGSSSVQQAALRDFDRALRSWWAGTHRRPTWRKAARHSSFHVRDLTVRRLSRRWAEVTIPKAGRVRFRLTRPFDQVAAATSARVALDSAGRWHVSFTTPPPVFQRAMTGRSVGIDRGVVNSVATSDGELLHAPGLTDGERARFLALSRRLARQTRPRDPATGRRTDSRRRAATKAALARLHARLGDRRRDWVEQTTTALARDYDLIAIEDLRTRQMTKRPAPKPDPDQPTAFLPNGARAKAGLNRAILASCWGGIEQRLHHKTSSSGTCVLVKVDPRNTSRRCAACGHTSGGNRESQAVFACQSCGHQAHADTNAAINILARATTTTSAAAAPPGNGLSGGTRRERTHQTTHSGRVNHQDAA